jgi:hypothetical protein
MECDYCGESFETEQSYLEHLDATHRGELGSIDRRRVESMGDGGGDGGTDRTGPLVLGVVLLIAVGLVAYVVLFLGGSGGSSTVNGFEIAQTPGPVGSVHEHGLLNVTVDGQRIDFSQPRYQYQQTGFDAFHFEGGNGRIWHKHAPGVTLEYAMATLGFGVTGDSVTVDGTTYQDGDDGTDVTVTVNGQPVTPSEYVLQGASDATPEEGDQVRVVVTTAAG